MLLIAFTFLPTAMQRHLTAALRQRVCLHTAAASSRTLQEWGQLLAELNPVLTWQPAEACLTLTEHSWQQLLQFSQSYVRRPSRSLVPTVSGDDGAKMGSGHEGVAAVPFTLRVAGQH